MFEINSSKVLTLIFLTAILWSVSYVESQELCDRRYLNDEIRIDGKVVIITGGTSGLGLEAARNLANRGGIIYLAARGQTKGLEAIEFIKKSTGNENVRFIQLDLGSLASVRAFSRNFHSVENRLDILINNAGVVTHYNKTENNFELNMGINHLGHFLLTNLLLDLLKASAPSRIVVVSSVAHYLGFLSRSNLNSEIYFPGFFKAYGNSKLANVLFTRELARRLKGTGVTVNSCDPGPSMSGVISNLNPILRTFLEPLQQMFWRSPEHGSQSHIMLAIDPSVENISGEYFLDCKSKFTHPQAYDDNLARWLWDESVRLTELNKKEN